MKDATSKARAYAQSPLGIRPVEYGAYLDGYSAGWVAAKADTFEIETAYRAQSSDEHAGPVVGRKDDQGANHEGPVASMVDSKPSTVNHAQDVYGCGGCGTEWNLEAPWRDHQCTARSQGLLQDEIDSLRREVARWRWVPEILAGQKFDNPVRAKEFFEDELVRYRREIEALKAQTQDDTTSCKPHKWAPMAFEPGEICTVCRTVRVLAPEHPHGGCVHLGMWRNEDGSKVCRDCGLAVPQNVSKPCAQAKCPSCKQLSQFNGDCVNSMCPDSTPHNCAQAQQAPSSSGCWCSACTCKVDKP